MNDNSPEIQRLRSLIEDSRTQDFLRRHNLVTTGETLLAREEIEKRFKRIDEQYTRDLLAQSIVEVALNIKRPLRKSSLEKRLKNRPSILTLYDNSCAITMLYQGRKVSQQQDLLEMKISSDEIIIIQQQTSVDSNLVYKSTIKPNAEFTFRSTRSIDRSFTIAIYVNGVIDNRISTCCEYGYLRQQSLGSKRNSFHILHISGGTACQTCQMNNLIESSVFSENELSVENFNIPIKSFDDSSAYFEVSETLTMTPINFNANENGRFQEAENNSTSFNQFDDIINKKEKAVSKMYSNGDFAMKISENKEGFISTIANYEIQQLLSKYLLLIVPSSQIRHHENNTDFNIPATSVLNRVGTNHLLQSNHQNEIISNGNIFEYSQQENIELFMLIWLDSNTKCPAHFQTKLRTIINSILTFHTVDQTINYIENMKTEKVFLILSSSFLWDFISRKEIHNLTQLNSIYIFSLKKLKCTELIEHNHKIRGLFTDIDSLCIQLNADTERCSNDMLPISIGFNKTNQNEENHDTYDQEKQIAFLRSQLHHELLINMEHRDDMRFDLVQFSENMYKDNRTEENFIKELRNNYTSDKAIWWYTRSNFLYKMLNAAFYRQDITVLYKFHFYIRDLHTQLEQFCHLHKLSLESRTFIVYRGLGMSMKTFDETIRKQVNNLLSFDAFFLTNLNKDVALKCAKHKSSFDDESILLEFKINCSKIRRPFADISFFGDRKRGNEILFSIGSIFRIDSVSESKFTDGIWRVYLSSIDEDDAKLMLHTKAIQSTLMNFFERVDETLCKCNDQYRIAENYVNMANLHYKQRQYEISLDLYKKSLEILLSSSRISQLIAAKSATNIARTYVALRKFDEALKFYEKVLDIRYQNCKTHDILCINTLLTVGHIYLEIKQYDRAVTYYLKILDVKVLSQSNPSFIAIAYIHIALIYYQRNQIKQTLEHFDKALECQRRYLSERHPILIYLYNNIAALYYQLNQFDLALQNQLFVLQIEEQSLPKRHTLFSVTYSNIAKIYEQLKNYDAAIQYAERAINQLKLSQTINSSSDLEIKQNYLNKLVTEKRALRNKVVI